MMRLKDISSVLKLHCPEDKMLTGISIDSRQVKPGNLFFAIRGERFDGQQFISDAVVNGAAAIVCCEAVQGIDIPQLIVQDTLKALTSIATSYRQTLSCDVIALTGSNGKTTVKEMIAAILPKPSYATPGNLNNHIGVPLSILQLQPSHRYAVFELGANHQGEIAHTVAIVKPRVALITNIAPAHIEGFGSIDGVAKAKGEIYQGITEHGIAVINDDDHYAHFWDSLLVDRNVVRFSTVKPAEIYAKDITFDIEGYGAFVLVVPNDDVLITLKVAGAHNVSNAVAAAACTYALGVDLSDIASGLQAFRGVAGRMTFLKGKNNSLVIDDTYNANLKSSLTAIDVLAKRQGRRIFVFGDMAELGRWSEQHHQEVGEAARRSGIDVLMTCGKHSESTTKAFGETGKHYQHQDELVHDLITQLNANTTVLVKGSRSSSMEKIVHQLMG